jgi:hypothetical protein
MEHSVPLREHLPRWKINSFKGIKNCNGVEPTNYSKIATSLCSQKKVSQLITIIEQKENGINKNPNKKLL